MTKYESMLIARQDLGQSQVNDIVATLSEAIKKEGGEVVNVDNWGLKNLAYRIKKEPQGLLCCIKHFRSRERNF